MIINFIIVYLVSGGTGYYLAFSITGRKEFNWRIAGQILILGGFVLALFAQPPIYLLGISGLKAHVPYVILSFFVGGFYFFGERSLKISIGFDQIANMRHFRKLTLLIALVIFLTLSSIVPLIAQNWDVSGWMDSHTYDLIAHQIVTGEVPQGSSFYMPLFQYGMALIYYIFGHFFFVQQIVNVILACLTTTLLCLTAWTIFRNYWAVLFMGTWAALTSQLHHAPHYTQIENWYIPLVSLVLLLWSRYWDKPSVKSIILLSISIGFALNTRTQGAFFFLILFLVPAVIPGLKMRRVSSHGLIMAVIVGGMLLPWTMRNYIYEGRFSPSSNQAIIQLCALNDRRTSFYGIRYDIGYTEVVNEYMEKYPDIDERLTAMRRDAIRNIFGDPIWLAKGVFWRTLAFYNLLPPGVWAEGGPQPTDWSVHWLGFVYLSMPFLFCLLGSFVGLLTSLNRTSFFLLLCILGNLAIVIFAACAEPRISYPVLPLHMLLALCAFWEPIKPGKEEKGLVLQPVFTKGKMGRVAIISCSLILFSVLCYVTFGKDNRHRNLLEPAVIFDEGLSIDEKLPSLNAYFYWSNHQKGEEPMFENGQTIRVRVKVSNYMFPPKYAGAVPWIPKFATDPKRETYYYAYPLEGGNIGMSFFGARLDSPVREGDVVEVEGAIGYKNEHSDRPKFWIKAKKLKSLVNNTDKLRTYSLLLSLPQGCMLT